MLKNKKIKQLKKEITQTCPICQQVYQLLEIHYQSKENIELLKGNCLNNCLQKWQQTLQDYHSKELMADLAQKEQKEDEIIDKFTDQVYQNWKKK